MYTWRQSTKYTEVILALRSKGYLMEARGMASRRQPIQETMEERQNNLRLNDSYHNLE